MQTAKYERIMLKVSGEVLQGERRLSIDREILENIAQQIVKVRSLNIKIAITIGGGNIFRGSDEDFVSRCSADTIGMLATVQNGLALEDMLKRQGLAVALFSIFSIGTIVQGYRREEAKQKFDDGFIVILCGGTGLPYFTTDTAAVLYGIDLGVEVILKGTKVDGIYSDDPTQNVCAKKYDSLSYSEVLKQNLKVMDLTAISLCMQYNLPIIIFNLTTPDFMFRILRGESLGSIIC